MEKGTIRKITIGKEAGQNSMTFTIGQAFRNGYTVHSIVEKSDETIYVYIMKTDEYEVYKNTGKENGEILPWKKIHRDTPVVLEFSQDFS